MMQLRIDQYKFPYLGICSKCFAVVSGDGVVLFDSGLACGFEPFSTYNKKHVSVLCTHGHWDHIGNLKMLQEAGAHIFAHYGDARYFTDFQWHWDILFEQFRNDFLLPKERKEAFIQGIGKPVTPDTWILGEKTLELFGHTIRVLHTPGHSDGSVCYFFEEEGWLFTGDTLMGNGFFSGIPQITNPEAYRNSMNHLFSIDAEQVFCDHSEVLQERGFSRKILESMGCLERMESYVYEVVRRGRYEPKRLVAVAAETICRRENKTIGGGACITALSLIRTMAGQFDLAAECAALYKTL